MFYDPAVRSAPLSEAEYLAADHATVAYEARRGLERWTNCWRRAACAVAWWCVCQGLPHCQRLCGGLRCSPPLHR